MPQSKPNRMTKISKKCSKLTWTDMWFWNSLDRVDLVKSTKFRIDRRIRYWRWKWCQNSSSF